MAEFKIGDQIQVTGKGENYFSGRVLGGDAGTVVRVDSYDEFAYSAQYKVEVARLPENEFWFESGEIEALDG